MRNTDKQAEVNDKSIETNINNREKKDMSTNMVQIDNERLRAKERDRNRAVDREKETNKVTCHEQKE